MSLAAFTRKHLEMSLIFPITAILVKNLFILKTTWTTPSQK